MTKVLLVIGADLAAGTEPAGPPYGGLRTVAGLTVCVALLLAAGVLWRRTDWSAPSEAATPELDGAVLGPLD